MNEMMSSVASPVRSPRPEVPPPTIPELHKYANLWGIGAARPSTKVDELRRYFRAFAVFVVCGEDKYCTEVNRQCRIWKVDVKPQNFPENLWKNPNNGPDRLKQPQLIDAMDHIIHLFKESSDQTMARHPRPAAESSGYASLDRLLSADDTNDSTSMTRPLRALKLQCDQPVHDIRSHEAHVGQAPSRQSHHVTNQEVRQSESTSVENQDSTISWEQLNSMGLDVNGAQASGTSPESAYAASLYLMNLTENDLCPRPDMEAIDVAEIDSGHFSGEVNSHGGSIAYDPQTVSPPQQVPVQSITNNNTAEDSTFDYLDKIILQPLSPEREAYLGSKLIRRMNLSGRSSPISLQEKDPEEYNELMRQIEPSAAEVTEEMDTTSPPPSPRTNAPIPTFVMDEDEDAFDEL